MAGVAMEWEGPWTLERVQKLELEALLALFSNLPAPGFEELTGEYRGYAGKGATSEATAAQHAALFDETSPFGYWLGKAFTRHPDGTTGEGYNHCRKNGQVVRHLRFGTGMGASHLDGKPAFVLTYAAFKNRSGAADLKDEVRTLGPGLYLGLATYRSADGGRTQPSAFFLEGPIADYAAPDDPTKERRD